MNIYKYFFGLTKLSIICLGLSFFSCSKSDITQKMDSDQTLKVPSYKTVESLIDLRKTIFSLTHEERMAYEDSHGYKSFGRICDELYFSILPSKFNSIEEAKTFVADHSEYLQLIVGEDGSLTLETVDYNNPYRYFMDINKMFRIGNSMYKVFDANIASTTVEDAEKLKSLTSENLSSLNDEKITVFNYKFSNRDNQLKDVALNCGTHLDNSVDNDRNRTHYELDIYEMDQSGTMVYSHYLVRPYYKTLGIWYWCQRTISADIKVANDYYVTPTWGRITETYYNSGELAYSLSGDLGVYWISAPNSVPHIFHFGGYYILADTPSTPSISDQCNAGYFW
jgi:hypothetical protein